MILSTRRILPLLLLAQSARALDFDNDGLRVAVNAWLDDPKAATDTYGPIESWKTWRVSDMSRLFQGAVSFNANLNSWDLASVTDVHHMFAGCEAFDSPLDNWDVSSVVDFSFMFYGAKNFTGNSLGSWQTPSAQTMEQMFLGATNFIGSKDLQNWDVSRVTSMHAMFFQATSFDRPVNNWDMTNVRHTNSLFEGASKFSQKVCWPNTHPLSKCFQCFCGTSDAGFDMESTCTANVHPSIQAYSQACDPDDILEDLVESQIFGRPGGNNFEEGLGASETISDGLAGLPSLVDLDDDPSVESSSSNGAGTATTTAEDEMNLEGGDRGIDEPNNEPMVIAAAQQETSAVRWSRPLGLVISCVAVLASTAMSC